MAHRLGATISRAVLFSALGMGLLSPAYGAITLQVGTVEAAPGERVSIPVVLHTDGEAVSVFQNDLVFDPQTGPAGLGERPTCTQHPGVSPAEVGSRFSVLPCPGSDCEIVRAQTGAFQTVVPTDVVLYTCSVEVEADAAFGSYGVGCVNFFTSDAFGNELGGVCNEGTVVVVDRPLPTPVDTPATVDSAADASTRHHAGGRGR